VLIEFNRMDAYREQILKLLERRGPTKTICPSEVLSESEKQRPECMERVRRSARRLAIEGKIEITQRGRVVQPDQIRGPIRLRTKREG
jgi:hypothetical protein